MKKEGYSVALVGADGGLAEHVLAALEASQVPIAQLIPVLVDADEAFVGQWQGQAVLGQDIEAVDFSLCDGVIFAAGSRVSKDWAPKVVEAGAWVLDLSSAFHEVEGIPMVVMGVNDGEVFNDKLPAFVTQPSCMAQALCLLLHRLRSLGPLHRVEVATYQAAVGAGQKGVEALIAGSAALLNGQTLTEEEVRSAAFNTIAVIDQLLPNGYSQEEARIFKECQKVLGDDRLVVNATAVRVPVFYGHGAAVHVFFAREITEQAITDTLKTTGALSWHQDPFEASSIATTQADPPLRISRVRQDWVDPCGLHLWLMCDTVQRGMAWNAAQLVHRFVLGTQG